MSRDLHGRACGPLTGLLFAAAVACSSSSSGTGGGGSPTCSYAGAASCAGGTKVTYCYTGSSTSPCTSAYYTVGSQQFPCNSCSTTDLINCGAAAATACLGDAGGSSGGDAAKE